MDQKTILNKLKQLKKIAKDLKIPTIHKETYTYLAKLIAKEEITNILEIGTESGYNAIVLALTNPNIRVTTIEKNQSKYLMALKSIKELKLENQISLVYADNLETKLEDKYDLVYGDAFKITSIDFFDLYERNIKDEGVLVSDNLTFFNKCNSEEELSPGITKAITKIEEYKQTLETNENYETMFYNVGYGLALSKKRSLK